MNQKCLHLGGFDRCFFLQMLTYQTATEDNKFESYFIRLEKIGVGCFSINLIAKPFHHFLTQKRMKSKCRKSILHILYSMSFNLFNSLTLFLTVRCTLSMVCRHRVSNNDLLDVAHRPLQALIKTKNIFCNCLVTV